MENKFVDQKLTILQAYKAMFVFVASFYAKLGKSATFEDLLGECSLLQDNMPGDLARWNDWLAAVENVLSGEDDLVYFNKNGIAK